MVCLSAAILTKQGKVLLARQFVEMTRMKVENHLTTFPKLIGTDRQHNTVETAEVRYVYQPIEALILVLTTSKLSNIVEDLETLRLFSKVIPEYCPGEIDEASVCKNAFELLFAFDELIACGVGHRENLTLQQVQVNLEMESHEEKLALMIRQSKEREAQQEAERRRKQIARDNRSKGMGGGNSLSGGITSMRDFADDLRSGAAAAAATVEANAMSFDPTMARPSGAPPPKAGTGMKLGKGPKGGGGAPSSMLQALAAEAEDISAAAAPARPGVPASAGAASPGGGAAAAGITLTAEEKLAVTMNREGGLQQLEMNGILQLLNTDAANGKAVVPLQMGPNPGFQFKTHPNIDKQLFANETTLGLRDPTRPFPVGSAVGVLKWRLVSTDEALVPLVINAWPTQTGGTSWEVTVEYELSNAYPNLEIHNLSVTIPAPVDAPPGIDASAGTATFSRRENAVTWSVPLIDSTATSGTVELQLNGLPSADSLYPITVDFSAASTLCSITIPEVRSAEAGGGALPFTSAATLLVDSYTIQ